MERSLSYAMMRAMNNPKEWLTTAEVAEYLNESIHTLYSWNSRGGGPPRYRLGKGLRYRRSEVDQWIRSRLVESRQPART